MTYIVRPRIEPRKRSVSVARISSGSRQLLVGPASIASREQMKVRSSTRATSLGSERARKLFGRLSGLSGGERAGLDELCAQGGVLLVGAVAPMDAVGHGQGGDLVDPAD